MRFVMLPWFPRRAGAVMITVIMLTAASAWANEATPFRVAQSTLPPSAIPGDSSDGGDSETAALVVRVDRLESDLRRANGQIEELQNQNAKLEDRMRRFQQDVEYRLGGGAAAAGAPPPGPTPDLGAPKPRKGGDAFDPGADPIGMAAPSPPLGAPIGKPPPPASAPMDLASRAPLAPPKGADSGPTVIGSGLPFTDGPRDQFNGAVAAYKEGQYADAEAQLKAFLAANPTHSRAADAIFYLGETYLQRSRPREAAEQYLRLSTDYGKSAKAPEGMMRLGQSLAMLGNNEQACATFAEVGKRYPTASSFVRKSVEHEIQNHHCQ
jgi:tol-pal system protein YbgF